MTRIASNLIPRPKPTIANGKIYEPKLNCHICGKPGKWYPLHFGWKEVLGEILCDECSTPPEIVSNVIEVDQNGKVHDAMPKLLADIGSDIMQSINQDIEDAILRGRRE